jgi:cytochrome c oxidase subunit 1
VGAFLLGHLDAAVHLERLQEPQVAPRVTVDDPWGWGRSLEWATSCPPPRHNFTSLPRIRSEAPAFDLHYPEISGRRGVEQPESKPALEEEANR